MAQNAWLLPEQAASPEDRLKAVDEKFPPLVQKAAPMAEPAKPTMAMPGQGAVINPNQPVAPNDTDYANMSWGEVGSRALQAAPKSFAKTIGQFGEAITHPAETLGAIGQLGTGIVSKGAGFFQEQDPQKKAADEAVLDAIMRHYGEVYGDTFSGASGLKKELATDPFSVGMDVATIAPAVGAVSKAAGLGKFGKVAETAISALDPVQAAVMAGKGITSGGKMVGKELLSNTTGVPRSALDIIENVGKSNDRVGQQVFKEYMSGKGAPESIPDTAIKALDELKQAASDNYVSQHQNLISDPLNTTKIDDAFQEVYKDLGTNPQALNPDSLNALRDMYTKYQSLPNMTAVALDDLRKSLSADLSDFSRTTRGATMKGSFNKILNSIKETISAKDPTYARMLDDWQKWRDQLQQFQGTFGLKQNVTTASRLAKLLKSLKTGDKQNLLNQLAQTQSGKYLPHMIAGTAVSDWLPDWAHRVQDLALYGLAGTQFGFGVPHALAAAASASPRLVGSGAYALGKGEKLAGMAKPLVSAPTTNVLSQIGGMMEPAPVVGTEPRPVEGSYFAGGRVARQSGGRVGNPGSAADKLIAAAEKAKNSHSETTSPLLDVPDEAITKALAIANEKI